MFLVNIVEGSLIALNIETFRLFIKNIQCQHIIYGCRLDQHSLRFLQPYRENVLDSSRISILGRLHASLQSTSDALDLIAATNSGTSPTKRDGTSANFDQRSTSSPIKLQTPRTVRGNSETRLDSSASAIYRFSEKRARHNNNVSGHHFPIALDHIPNSPSGSNSYANEQNSALATKTWDLEQRTVLLNVNNERVDADLGPVNPQAEKNLSRRTVWQKLCNNYVLSGQCAQAHACPYAHDGGLDGKEMVALAYRARHLPCERGSECRSSKCWYGHTCVPNCTGGSKCFKQLHHVDRTAVKVWQPRPT